MSLDRTLFIGNCPSSPSPLPLQEILDHFAIIRDAIAATGYSEPTTLVSYVANVSFVYAFNTFKSVSLLITELYHESGAVLLRQLWEVSLNLHWIEGDAETRAQEFCNFTIMEYRKFIQKTGESGNLTDFDSATGKFQAKYHYRDKRGKKRIRSGFSTTNTRERADALGDPWKTEYDIVYQLTSMHCHGAPGAVLHGIFLQQYRNPEIREKKSASLIGILAINIMVRNVELLARMNIIPDPSGVLKAYASFQETMKNLSDC